PLQRLISAVAPIVGGVPGYAGVGGMAARGDRRRAHRPRGGRTVRRRIVGHAPAVEREADRADAEAGHLTGHRRRVVNHRTQPYFGDWVVAGIVDRRTDRQRRLVDLPPLIHSPTPTVVLLLR